MKDDELQRWADAFRDEFRPPAELRAKVDRRVAVDDLDRWSKAFRDEYAPPPGLREDVARALQREAPTQQPRARWVAGFVGGAFLGAAALTLLSWALPAPETPTERIAEPVEAVDRAPETVPSAAPMRVPAPPPAVKPNPSAAAAPKLAPAPRTPRSRPAPDPGPTTPAASTDLEELRRLRAAETALEREAYDEALTLLADHADAFPRSKFMLEREALWLRASCARGDAGDVARRFRAFLRRPRAGAYHAKVRSACAELEAAQ